MEPGWQQHLLLVHHPSQPIEMGHDQCGLGRPSRFLQRWCQMKKSLLLRAGKKRKKGEKNQWCLEGIKEWENRIQLASWSPRRITSPAHCFQMPCIFPCAASSQPHHWRGSRFQHPSTTRSLGKITRKYRDNKEMWQPKKRSEIVLGLIWNTRGSRGSMEPCHIGKLKSNQTSSHCMLL